MPLDRIAMPEFGRIVGGRLAGWYFKFLHYVPLADEAKVFARVTPPHWPFPRDILLESHHWGWFAAMKGATQLDGDKLIHEEYKAAGLPVPKYLVNGSLRLQTFVNADAKKRRKVS